MGSADELPRKPYNVCLLNIEYKNKVVFLSLRALYLTVIRVLSLSLSLSPIMVTRPHCRNIKGKKVPCSFLPLSASPQDLPPPPQLDFSRLVWASAVWKPDGNFLESACSTLTAS